MGRSLQTSGLTTQRRLLVRNVSHDDSFRDGGNDGDLPPLPFHLLQSQLCFLGGRQGQRDRLRSWAEGGTSQAGCRTQERNPWRQTQYPQSLHWPQGWLG